MKTGIEIVWFCFFVACGLAFGGPELDTMPVRHLWGDVDNDNLCDLFVLDRAGNCLFRNSGNGDFEDVTALYFPKGAGIGVGGFFGDYNRDGALDLFLFHEGGFTLHRNESGRSFVNETAASGLPETLSGVEARLDDFDEDGFEDLLLRTRTGERIFRNRRGVVFEEIMLPGLCENSVVGQGGAVIFAKSAEGADYSPAGGVDNPSGERGPQTDVGDSKVGRRPAPVGFTGKNGNSRGARRGAGTVAGCVEDLGQSDPGSLGEGGRNNDGDWDYSSHAPHMWAIPTGNVGIGTSTPESKLEVVDRSSSSDISELLKLKSESTNIGGDARIGFSLRNSQGTDQLGEIVAYKSGGDSVSYSFRTAEGASVDDAVVIREDGDVGIGTGSPETPLHVFHGSDVKPHQGGFIALGDMASINMAIDNNEIMARADDYASKLYINNEGGDVLVSGNGTAKVGIGTNSPFERLDLRDSSGNGALRLGDTSNANNGTIRWTGADFEGYDGAAWQSLTESSEPCLWKENGSDLLFMTGDVGIGKTDPGSLLDVDGSITGTGLEVNGGWNAVSGSAFSLWDQDELDDVTVTTSFGGDVSGNYDSLTLGTDVVDAAQIDANGVGADEIQSNAVGSSELKSTGTWTGYFGGGSKIPSMTVDEDGRITEIHFEDLGVHETIETVYISEIAAGDSAVLKRFPAKAWTNYYFQVDLVFRAIDDGGDGEGSVWILAGKTEADAASFDNTGKSCVKRIDLGSNDPVDLGIHNFYGGDVTLIVYNRSMISRGQVRATITSLETR